ncbi:MAG: gfo/Idh/MocA family oxidoreductase [Caldilineae bacterium]|nr:MAG: gfo/Idh/MocA family oxidoreductase [Caldilineae bacterium]
MGTIELTAAIPLPRSPRPIVIIGAGGIVNDAHLPAYRKAGFPVAGIFDIDQEKARRTAARFHVPTVYPSLEAAVEAGRVDVVYDVALPASALPQVLPALPDGATVLMQKPMGESLSEARTILEICRSKSLNASVNFQLRYAPFVLAARSLIEQGAIGELVGLRVDVAVYTPWHLWSFLERVSCMEVKYHSIHYLDLVRSFVGDPLGVHARVTNHPLAPNMDGTCSAMILVYRDDLAVTVQTNHFFRFGLTHQQSSITWEGARGAIKATMGLLMNYPEGVPDRFEFFAEGVEVIGPEVFDSPTGEGWREARFEGSWFPDAFVGTMAAAQRAAEGSGPRQPTHVEDAYRTMALVEAACRSSRQGPPPIDYETP